MENDKLTQLWNQTKENSTFGSPETILKKAKKQQNGQFITITVMSIFTLLLIIYAIYYINSPKNSFAFGLFLMISSLVFRIILEFASLYQKENQLRSLDNLSFKKYLKKYSKIRLKINYYITPLCFGVYIYGFIQLLPYFKNVFSKGFYNYILISGIVSLLVLAAIIINSTRKERDFFNEIVSK